MPDNHIFVYKSQLEVYFWVSLVAPASAGDMGSIPDPGRSHMSQSNPCATAVEPVL